MKPNYYDTEKEHGKKNKIELKNASLVEGVGSWFGLTGPGITKHWKMFKNMLSDDSKMVIVERHKSVFKDIVDIAKKLNPNKIEVYNDSLFEAIKKVEINSDSSKFAYGHLDFCSNSMTMMRDENMIPNLFWLSNSGLLRDTFYMDFTVTDRRDEFAFYETLLEDLVPKIFKVNGWEVTCPKSEDLNKPPYSKYNYRYTQLYKEHKGPHMRNAFYKFKKIK